MWPFVLWTMVFVGRCTARSPLDKNRYDTSLGLLTKKFVGLLTSAEEGVGGVLCILSMYLC